MAQSDVYLTWEDCCAVRVLDAHVPAVKQAGLARALGCAQQTINGICAGRYYLAPDRDLDERRRVAALPLHERRRLLLTRAEAWALAHPDELAVYLKAAVRAERERRLVDLEMERIARALFAAVARQRAAAQQAQTQQVVAQ